MDYMTLKEAAGQWGVTPRRVNYYCADVYKRQGVCPENFKLEVFPVCREATG